jgi:homoserine kinase
VDVTVRVPATSANLGPGFDCLGLAISLHNDLLVTTDVPFSISITGEGVERIPRDRSNLVYRTMERFFAEVGVISPRYSLNIVNRIPLSGGLGSSSAAVVGGLLAANVIAGAPCTVTELLQIATTIEGHPDNVAPALLGGIVIAAMASNKVITMSIPVPAGLRAVVFSPNFVMSTYDARRLLPASVPRADAVFNISRAALMVGALCTGQLQLLKVATEDQLHQPARATLYPALPRLINAAIDAGAHGAFLSGAGSAVMAFYTGQPERIASALCQTANDCGLAGRVLFCDIDPDGAQVTQPGSPVRITV